LQAWKKYARFTYLAIAVATICRILVDRLAKGNQEGQTLAAIVLTAKGSLLFIMEKKLGMENVKIVPLLK
jgi:hypothetical protein